MSSPQRILSNSQNHILNSTLLASSVRSATDTVFNKIIPRTGFGKIQLLGDYTGLNDATLDIEITSDVSTSLRVSNPRFIGSGSGTLSNLSADSGATPENITVTLTDTGILTKVAELDFFGVLLRARSTGLVGNDINLSVDRSGIAYSSTLYSVITNIPKDTDELEGAEYVWGSKPLLGDGTLDSNTLRFTFGEDPTVYREYSVYQNGKVLFKLDPPTVGEIKSGTLLKQVTGTYTVTVTDGVTTEVYTNIISLYDLLIKLRSQSNLLEVIGVVIDDRTPGGMAVDELPLRTTSYAMASYSSGTGTLLENTVIADDCPGQLIEIKCTNNDTVGGEVWKVTAPSQGGAIGDAVTGIHFVDSNFEFTIPRIIPENASSVGMDIDIKDITFAAREPGEKTPNICADIPTCGINAAAKTITCVYTDRSTTDCKCEDATYEGSLNASCLGIEIEEGSGMSLDPELQTRLQSLYNWRAGIIESNTSLGHGRAWGAATDIKLIESLTTIFSDALLEIWSSATARAQWDTELTTLGTDLTSIATELGASAFDTDGWPTGAKVWQNGTSLSVGDYVKTDRDDVAPVCLKVTTTVRKLISSPYTATFGSSVTIQDIAGGGSINILSDWPTAHDDYSPILVSLDTSYNYYVIIKEIVPEVRLISSQSDLDNFAMRYKSRMDKVRVLAGILPKGKAGGQGNECWQARDDAFYWTVNGLEYLPAYTNVVYHSCKGKTDGSVVKCTREFAFVIKVNEACQGYLKPGDTVIFEITGENTGNKSYAIGDAYYLPIIYGSPQYLAGGVNGNDTLTWSVRGSTSGVLTDLTMVGVISSDYNSHNLHFMISKGVIPFSLNDEFSFSIEGGTFKWRFNGGAWSSDIDIPLAPVLLTDGLSAKFVPGSVPSYVIGDQFSYQIKQPFASTNMNTPGLSLYEWEESSTLITATFDSDVSMEGFAIGHHRLPSDAVLTLKGYDEFDTELWDETLTYSSSVIFIAFGTLRTVRKLTLDVSNAPNSGIGWVWAGVGLSFTNCCSSIKLNRTWKTASTGRFGSRYLGTGAAGSIEWDGDKSWLLQEDVDNLTQVIDYSKSNNDEPVIFIPNIDNVDEARLVRIDTDSLELSEWYSFQTPGKTDRIIGASIPFSAIIR